MAKELVNLRITRVDLVDMGANFDRDTGDGSHIMIYKRADDDDLEAGDGEDLTTAVNTITKAGRKISANRLGKLRELVTTLTEFITEAEHTIMPNDQIEEDATEKADVVQDVQKSIDDAVAKALADTNDKLEKAHAAVEKATERAEQAETIAKSEQDRRITKSFEDKIVNDWQGVPGIKADEDIEVFKALSAFDPEKWNRIDALFSGAAEAIRTGTLFGEQGSDGAGDTSASAQGEINKRADKLVDDSSDTLQFGDAVVKVCADDPVLYQRHLDEQQKRVRTVA